MLYNAHLCCHGSFEHNADLCCHGSFEHNAHLCFHGSFEYNVDLCCIMLIYAVKAHLSIMLFYHAL